MVFRDPISAADLKGAVSESKAISESEYKTRKDETVDSWRLYSLPFASSR